MATPWASTTPSGSRAHPRYPGMEEEESYIGCNGVYHIEDNEVNNAAFIGDHSMMTGGILPPRGVPYTQKIPPSFNGRTNWLEFETRVREWADICSVEPDRKARMHQPYKTWPPYTKKILTEKTKGQSRRS